MPQAQQKLRFSRPEKKQFDGLIARLEKDGRDVEALAPIVGDYVRAESRISALTNLEAKSQGKSQAGATRALNALQDSRRKLYRLIFRQDTSGGCVGDGEQFTAEELAQAEIDMAEGSAVRRHWYVLMPGGYGRSLAAEAWFWRVVAQYNAQHRLPDNTPLYVRVWESRFGQTLTCEPADYSNTPGFDG